MFSFPVLRALRHGLLAGILLLSSLAYLTLPAAAANSTVGTGSPASCTEAAFDTAFMAVQNSGGGTLTFNCGPAPLILIFSAIKPVSANTVLQGGDLITLSGGNSISLFQVFSNQALTLSHITLSRASGNNGAVENFGSLTLDHSQITNSSAIFSGGAILNHNTVTIANSSITGNSAAQNGGGIYSDGGSVTITNSQFANNTSTGDGGAIMVDASAAGLSIGASQFTGNQTTGVFSQGGAIDSLSATTITQSTFSQNHSSRGGGLSVIAGATHVTQTSFEGNWGAYGGAIRQEGGDLTLTDVSFKRNGYDSTGAKLTTGGGAISWGNGNAALMNVTLASNWASYGGGFDHSNGVTNLVNVTITGNDAVGSGGFDQDGGAINLTNVTITNNTALFFGAGISSRSGIISIKNTLVSENYKPDTNQKVNCNKALAASFSLSSDFTCGFGAGKDGVTLSMHPLANNGGFTQTQLPAPGSPVIDAGTGTGCPAKDQRGVVRPQGQACDIGAVEATTDAFALYYKAFIPLTVR